MTEEECIENGGHCWVDTGMMLTSSPPQYPQKCKHCPKTRRKVAREAWEYIYE